MEYYADGILKELKRLNHNIEKLSEGLLQKFEKTGDVSLTQEEHDDLVNALCSAWEEERQEND